jgi:hypothetical protein
MSNVKNVQVMLKGYCNVYWKEKRQDKNHQHRKGTWYHYRNHEEYVEDNIFVHHGTLATGNHVLPFSFLLPENLPTSFEGEHGHIRYFIESKVEHSGLLNSNKRNKQFITINSIVDLNVIAGVNMPQTNSDTKIHGSLWCKSGPLSATVSTTRYGFTPGEIMPISAEIENLSKKNIKCTKAMLYQYMTFSATSGGNKKNKRTKRCVQEVQRGKIEAGGTDTWNSIGLSIPPLPPSGLGGCRMINVSYALEFRVNPSVEGSDLVVYMPITIGSIPLRWYFQQLSSARINSSQFNHTEPTLQEEFDTKEAFSGSNVGHSTNQPHNANNTAHTCSEVTYNPTVPIMPPTCYSDLPPPSYTSVAEYDHGRYYELMSDEDSGNIYANWDYNPQYLMWSMPLAPTEC